MKNGFIQNQFGGKIWYKNGQVHRLNGPAEITLVDMGVVTFWYKNGCIHRLDGPAINYHNNKTLYWFINGTNITNELDQYCRSHNIDINDYKNLKFSDKLKLKFEFGLQL